MKSVENILKIRDRSEFRNWLSENSKSQKECWLVCRRGRPLDEEHFWYIDAVEEALCFGWIDSTLGIVDGIRMQRFAPRGRNSDWTELNKERVRRLEKLGLMTDAGRAVLPDMDFHIDPEIEKDIKNLGVWNTFIGFPALYQRVRAYNLAFTRKRSEKEYAVSLNNFYVKTQKGEMYGQWNDYGRLL